jgi:hypothetical protein
MANSMGYLKKMSFSEKSIRSMKKNSSSLIHKTCAHKTTKKMENSEEYSKPWPCEDIYAFDFSRDKLKNVYWVPRMTLWRSETTSPHIGSVPENGQIGHLRYFIKQSNTYKNRLKNKRAPSDFDIYSDKRLDTVPLDDSVIIDGNMGGLTRTRPLVVKTKKNNQKRKRTNWKRKYEELLKRHEILQKQNAAIKISNEQSKKATIH